MEDLKIISKRIQPTFGEVRSTEMTILEPVRWLWTESKAPVDQQVAIDQRVVVQVSQIKLDRVSSDSGHRQIRPVLGRLADDSRIYSFELFAYFKRLSQWEERLKKS